MKLLRVCAVAILSAAFAHNSCTGAARPNILLVIADDVGADSLSLFNTNAGATFPPTPTINSLSTNGVLFRNAYAYPTCSPSRSCMLTGRYGFRTGMGYAIVPPADPQLPSGELTLAEILSAQTTYHHACVGKWHLSFTNTTPNTLGGFSHFSGGLGGALPDYSSWPKIVNGVLTPNYSTYATTDNANDAISWIGQQGTNSWFLWLAFNAGHAPLHKPPNDLHSYDALPGTQMHINNNPRRYFEAMLEAMDTELARVLTNISLTNTTVIFIGDNGSTGMTIQPPYSSARGKGTLYEGGIRVPFIIAGASVTNQNRASTNLVHITDLFATILELAGVNLTAALTNRIIDSQSLVPILSNTATTNARVILTENFSDTLSDAVAGRALVDGRYKLIQFQNGTNEFYDLLMDFLEATNLLTRTLSIGEQNAYDTLTTKSSEWQARPALTSLTKTGQQFSLSFTPVQRYTYTLERRDDAGSGSWLNITSAIAPSSDATVRLTDTNAAGTNLFYRVQGVIP
ncbi:MAG TPA: sulfatase-like hydrolase/transferase [Verrucomicrobiae bacterium]